MHTLWGNRRGFSGVEMMIVVVVIGIIGGAVAGTQVHMKRRATERVVMGDLDAYAQAQMSVRHDHGRFASHADLLASGFQWSDDVELSEVRTADDRFFVRVRHTPTGYACAVDLSPVTGRARNRKVCRGSVSDPDLAVPTGIIVTPPVGDTMTVARPPTIPRIPDGDLLPPDVGDVPEVVLAPGSTRVVLFPVTNRSGEARVFTFGASSANPAVVPAPDRPADARLEAGERAAIPLAVSVAPGSLADQGGDVELRAADAGERGYAASGGVRVRAALVLAAPAVAVPAPEVRDPGETFTVQYRVRNASNAARIFRLGAAIPAGSALSLAGALSDQPLDALEERVVAVTYRLDGAADGGTLWTARLVVTDRDAAAFAETSAPFQVTARLALEVPVVAAPAARTEEPGAEITLLWQVTNRSNAPRDFRLTPGSDSPGLSPVSPAAAFSRRIGRGRTDEVAVTYRLAAGATCTSIHAATLGVSDAAAPDVATGASGTIRTATVLSAPAVSTPPARSDLPGASFGVTWQVTNRTNCERTIRVEVVPDGDVEVTGTSGAGAVRLQPFEQRAVEGRFRMRDNSVYQAESRPLLRATDEAAGAYTAAGAFVETTGLRLCAPTLEGPVGVPPQPQQPGTAATVTHRVTNCSNAARTFSFVAASGNPGAVPDPADPSVLAVPAFGTAEVEFGYALPAQAAGGAFSDLSLRAADAVDGSLANARSFRVTVAVVLNAPVLSAFAAQHLQPGEAGSSAAVLTSRSNVPVDFCFASSVAPGDASAGEVVAPAPPPPPCLRLRAYQAATVAQALSVAATADHPRSNIIMVRAYDAARPALAAEQGFPVTAGLLLAHPTLEVPVTPPALAWIVGQERSIVYPVVNRSNAARELCLSVVPGGAELLAPGAAPCTVVPARRGHTFQHVLRGATAGEPMVTVKVHDRLVPEFQDTGTFGARVVDATPVALWTPPSPVYMRKWAEFDAQRSSSPVGARIVKYVWSWGLFNQRWTGSRFEPGGSGVATDELSSPTTRRAWELRGTFQVCLVVEDDAGRRSPPNCREITTLAETRARLAFRYRGWWYDPSDFCVDVPWDNQCPKEHGNARWEILLNQSQGDVPIKRAWANVRVDYWQTDDRFEQAYSYTGNVETLPYSFSSGGQTVRYDFMSNRHKANGSVQTGRWRILDTNGTPALGWPQSPNLGLHPLVLNANLGSATGAFDNGPHWVPDEVWITLFVEDAFGGVTQQTRFLDHERSTWRGGECINGTSGWGCIRGYERLVPEQEAPVVSISRQDLGNGTYRFTGAGSSSDGRIVDSWWEISTSWFDPSQGRSETSVYRGEAYEVSPDLCEIVDVALVYVDDRGQQARVWERVSRADDRRCNEIGTPY